MTVSSHTEDQYLAAWLERVLPNLVEIYGLIIKETRDDDLATDFVCWIIDGGGVSKIETLEDLASLDVKTSTLRDSIVPTLISVYQNAIQANILSTRARRIAMSFAGSRWQFGKPGD